MTKMKVCARCGEEIGVSSGFLDSLFHALGSGLCDYCKKIRKMERYDYKEKKRQEYELERERAKARADEEKRRRPPNFGEFRDSGLRKRFFGPGRNIGIKLGRRRK